MQRYKQEIARQTQVIQKLHMYLATQNYDETRDKCDDNVSVTSAGQFEHGDLSVTREAKEEEDEECPQNENTENSEEILENGFKSTEDEFESKLKYLAAKTSEGGEYVQHMQKLQVSFICF